MVSAFVCRPQTDAAFFLPVAERVASLSPYQANTTANNFAVTDTRKQEFLETSAFFVA